MPEDESHARKRMGGVRQAERPGPRAGQEHGAGAVNPNSPGGHAKRAAACGPPNEASTGFPCGGYPMNEKAPHARNRSALSRPRDRRRPTGPARHRFFCPIIRPRSSPSSRCRAIPCPGNPMKEVFAGDGSDRDHAAVAANMAPQRDEGLQMSNVDLERGLCTTGVGQYRLALDW